MADEAVHQRLGEYCGAEAVASYGDVAAEFAALRHGCGIARLTWRARFVLTGSDRVRWLNGMVTNNIRDLAVGSGVYAFFLNPQGRIQADLHCFNRGEDLLIETDASQVAALRAAFDKFIIMDDVEIHDAEPATSVAVIGPKSPEVLRTIDPDAPSLAPLQMRTVDRDGAPLTVIRMDDAVTPGFELWLAASPAPQHPAATPVGFEALEMLRIWSGRPRFGQDIRERDLPQETGQEQRALNYSKGCYVGQEIVERIHSRGNVHRMFTGFAFESGPPPVGSKIEYEGKEVGEITSVATLPGDEGPPLVGLGYVRRESATSNAALSVAGVAARIVRPSFVYVPAGQ